MKLSIIIPAHNEEGCIAATVRNLHSTLTKANIEPEFLLVNDHSTDETPLIIKNLSKEIPGVTYVEQRKKPGYGMAVRAGLESFTGDAVVICMADGSENPVDVVRFFRVLEQDSVDCVFGSRFIAGGKVVDYPKSKLFFNRLANKFIQVLFGLEYNDVTNAFKMFRRHVIDGIQPFLSPHFNLTVELPLKAIVRGYSYEVVSNEWHQRKTGESKLKIKEMGSRYLFIVLYCFIEKWFSRGDFLVERRQSEVKKALP